MVCCTGTNCLLLTSYQLYRDKIVLAGKPEQTWRGYSWSAFRGWWQYLSLGVPAAAMICLVSVLCGCDGAVGVVWHSAPTALCRAHVGASERTHDYKTCCTVCTDVLCPCSALLCCWRTQEWWCWELMIFASGALVAVWQSQVLAKCGVR